jgi:hypothetical protein
MLTPKVVNTVIAEKAESTPATATSADDSPPDYDKAAAAASATGPATLLPATPIVKVQTVIREEESKTGKKLVPFLEPEARCKPAPRAELTPEQQKKYEGLLAHCNAIEAVPVATAKNAELKPLDADERMWLTKECLLRYLRASKWDLASSKKRLESTLTWRREYGVREHTSEYINIENETGKQVLLGYDNECRPCLYLNPARQNTERSPRQIHHLVFMLERVLDLMPAGQETLALLVDFKSSTNSSNPSVAQGRQVLSILQNHYPERLGRALIINSMAVITVV